MARVRTVSVRVTAEVSDLEKKLQSVQKSLKNTGKKLGKGIATAAKFGVALGAGVLAAGGAVFALGVKLGNTADELLDLNSITGMSTSQIQKWKKAAEVAGVSTEAMTNASTKLTKALDTMSVEGHKGQEALEAMGLSLSDIENMSADERMNVLTEALAGVDDKTERATLGADLFGGTWKEIAPIVDLGTEAMNKAKDSANIISEEDLVKANEFRIKVADMKEQLSFFVTEIAIAVMPTLQIMMDWVQDNMPKIKEIMKTVFTVIKTVITTYWTFIKDNLIPIWVSMYDWIKDKMPTIKETTTTTFDKIKEVANTVWTFFKNNVLPIFVSLYEWIKDNMPTIKETITTVFEKIEEVANMVWTFFKDNILPILEDLYDHIQSKMPQIKEIVETAFNAIKDVADIVWDIFENFLLPILEALWEFIEPKFPLIGTIIETAFDIVIGVVEGVIEVFETVTSTIETAVDWLTSWNDKDVKDKNVNMNTNYTSSGGGRMGGIPRGVRGFATGTNFVKNDGLAMLHQGEAVVPKKYNPANGGGSTLNHTGTIRVEGVNDRGQLVGVTEIIARDILTNQDRFAQTPSSRRVFR